MTNGTEVVATPEQIARSVTDPRTVVGTTLRRNLAPVVVENLEQAIASAVRDDRARRSIVGRLLEAREVAGLLGVGVRTLWRLVAAGKVPQPVRYSRKVVRWRGSELNRHLEDGS